jgi:D-glycero-alpha-D-manno-heptose 1-phosphate guanylyltransferase
MECIVLAGGLGTRLRGVIGEQPKCMASVAGQPFLAYLFKYLERQACTKVILSLGYKHEVVLEWLNTQTHAFKLDWVVEEEPLGTGGGIKLALEKAAEETVFILNGDTFFDVDLGQMKEQNSEAVIALKYLENFERYGSVTTGSDGYILSFEEKKPMQEGLINGGIYLISRKRFLDRHFPQKFSFEKDYLEAFVKEPVFFAYQSNGYFIDIGVPDDYERAQHDFKALFR